MTYFSPRLRAKITTIVNATGEWRATHGGHICEVRLDRTSLPGQQIHWRVCIARRWLKGMSGTGI